MSRLIFCVFLLCSKMLFSQIETKEAFLNQVYKDFIPENYQFFYLKFTIICAEFLLFSHKQYALPLNQAPYPNKLSRKN